MIRGKPFKGSLAGNDIVKAGEHLREHQTKAGHQGYTKDSFFFSFRLQTFYLA